jgi:hypothetical protein
MLADAFVCSSNFYPSVRVGVVRGPTLVDKIGA